MTLLMPLYPQVVYAARAVLWVVVHNKEMVYEQEDVIDTFAMRYGLMQKKIIPLNPQIEIDKPEI